jgi:hypothetical protein
VLLAAACSSHAPTPTPALAAPIARDAAPPDADCAPVDIYRQNARQIDVYCSHVDDRCCLPDGQWGCNNANYVDWYAKHCAR